MTFRDLQHAGVSVRGRERERDACNVQEKVEHKGLEIKTSAITQNIFDQKSALSKCKMETTHMQRTGSGLSVKKSPSFPPLGSVKAPKLEFAAATG